MSKIKEFEKSLRLLLSENEARFEVKNGSLYLFIADDETKDELIFNCHDGFNKYCQLDKPETTARPCSTKKNDE